MYGMHIEGEHGSYDGNIALFEMKLRDTDQQSENRTGACEDDPEVTTSVEGDAREEQDVFLSRPLRLRDHPVISHREQQEFEEGMERMLKFGFEHDFASAVYEHEVKQGRNPFLLDS